jgi:hypothetical protein
MIESTTLPLRSNINKDNIPNTHETERETAGNVFDRGFPFHESSSITNMLAELEDFNINNENQLPENTHLVLNHSNNPSVLFQTNNELTTLRAELEATRRKLAEYESRSKPIPRRSGPLTHNAESRSPFSSNSASFDFVHKDILPWSDYDSTFLEVPQQPHPSPVDFPSSFPPCRLPSAAVPFPGSIAEANPNSGTSIALFSSNS